MSKDQQNKGNGQISRGSEVRTDQAVSQGPKGRVCLAGLRMSKGDSVIGIEQARKTVEGGAASGILVPFCSLHEDLGSLLCMRWKPSGVEEK